MTEVGLSALASALTASTVRELDISENEVGSTGINDFCRAMDGNATLQVLTATGLPHRHQHFQVLFVHNFFNRV